MPTRAHDTDVGYDITAASYGIVTLYIGRKVPLDDVLFNPRIQTFEANLVRNVRSVLIDTGIHISPPPGYYVELVPNSRLAKTPFIFSNSIGIIDPSYTGSIKVALTATRPCCYEDLEKIAPGEVIGQLIIRKKHDAIFVVTGELEETERGDGGFGSTARKERA